MAGSYDVYAKSGCAPSQGYCAIALGLGGTVVNGGCLARFSPGNKYNFSALYLSDHVLLYVIKFICVCRNIWKTTQTQYLALNMDGPTAFGPDSHEVTSDVSTLSLPIIKVSHPIPLLPFLAPRPVKHSHLKYYIIVHAPSVTQAHW